VAATSWPEAAAKVRYVLNLYAAELPPDDRHHRDLVAAFMAGFARLSAEINPRSRSEGGWMTLERGSVRGFQFGRMVMLFSMMDGENEISCAVSNRAMDELEQVAWTLDDRREEQFLRLRDRIEQCASRKFQAGAFEGTPPGIILRSIDFRD
jgi:hypothetical protein